MIDWTKPIRTMHSNWPCEHISDKGRIPGYPHLVYVNANAANITAFSEEGWDTQAYIQLENVPEKKYVVMNECGHLWSSKPCQLMPAVSVARTNGGTVYELVKVKNG